MEPAGVFCATGWWTRGRPQRGFGPSYRPQSSPRAFFFRALLLGDAARVASIDSRSVVILAVFFVHFLGERLPELTL